MTCSPASPDFPDICGLDGVPSAGWRWRDLAANCTANMGLLELPRSAANKRQQGLTDRMQPPIRSP